MGQILLAGAAPLDRRSVILPLTATVSLAGPGARAAASTRKALLIVQAGGPNIAVDEAVDWTAGTKG